MTRRGGGTKQRGPIGCRRGRDAEMSWLKLLGCVLLAGFRESRRAARAGLACDGPTRAPVATGPAGAAIRRSCARAARFAGLDARQRRGIRCYCVASPSHAGCPGEHHAGREAGRAALAPLTAAPTCSEASGARSGGRTARASRTSGLTLSASSAAAAFDA